MTNDVNFQDNGHSCISMRVICIKKEDKQALEMNGIQKIDHGYSLLIEKSIPWKHRLASPDAI